LSCQTAFVDIPDMDIATSAAVIVGLQTSGKPGAESVKDFVGRLLGPAGDALGAAEAHPIVEFNRRRAERFSTMTLTAAQILQEAGIEPNPVPPYLLLPLLEKGSLIDDAALQAVWAQMLASASARQSDRDVWPSFPQILSELSPPEVQILGWIYDSWSKREPGPVERDVHLWIYHDSKELDHSVRAIIEDNLIRLQLLKPSHAVMRGDEVGKAFAALVESEERAYLGNSKLEDDRGGVHTVTALGWAFMKACAGPRNGSPPGHASAAP
jgi:hypothetical protein